MRWMTPADPVRSLESLRTDERLSVMIGEAAEREIGRREEVVGNDLARRIGELVMSAVVCTGMEVARPARGSPVAAHLHIPEQRFAEHHERFAGPGHTARDRPRARQRFSNN